MRFVLLNLVLVTVILLVAKLNATTETLDDRSNDVPMLIFSKVKSDVDFNFPIGSSIDQHEFKGHLEHLFPSTEKNKKKVAVIIVPSFEWADVLKHLSACQEIEKSEIYSQYPAVHKGYTELINYLLSIGVENEPIIIDDLENGIEDFCKLRKHTVYEGVVLTTLDNHDEKNDPHSVKHRNARAASISSIYSFKNNTDSFLFGDQCAALFNSIFIKNSTITSEKPVVTTLTIDESKSEFSCVANATNATMSLMFTGGTGAEYVTGVNLVFTRANRGWKLMNSTINTNIRELALTYMELPYSFETPFFYSIACTSARFKLSDPLNPKAFKQRIELYINGFQFQPFDVKNNKTSFTFGAVNYCGGFFTNGIWMGIATSLIMASILAMGVYLMVTVNTMDRFDDPKGKPLPINAEK